MDTRDAELLARLLPTFRLEAEEHLRQVDRLLSLFGKTADPEAIETAYREVHSLKGAARAVGVAALETLCQEMESVFASIRRGELAPSADLLDLLHRAADLAADLATAAGGETAPELRALAAETGRRLADAALSGTPTHPSPKSPKSPPETVEPPRQSPEVLRVGAERLEQLLLQAEELLTEKIAARGQAEVLQEIYSRLDTLRRLLPRTARREAVGERLQRTTEAVSAAGRELAELGATVREAALREGEHARLLGVKIESLLATVRATLMLPFGHLLDVLPRIARDLARESGKGVEVAIAGGDILIDRRLLEELRDPLLHLLRNAVDHGLESPPEREAAGKPARGELRIEASAPSPGRVLLTMSDDGRGFDFEKLRGAAVRDRLLTPERAAALDDFQAAELAFASGLTTRADPTEVSGRGLGLPIVREKVERFGGMVQIFSTPGAGATFRIEIPAVLAAFRGLLVQLGGERFIFPVTDVDRVLRLPGTPLPRVGNQEVIEADDAPLPVVRLEEPLRLPIRGGGEKPLNLVVTSTRQGRVAFAVDEIIAEEEFLVKGLGRLGGGPLFSGAAVLADGGLALILASEGLVAAASGMPAALPRAEASGRPRRRVLVVEDSITSRTLLRNILEGAGYAVMTAVDGLDALERLAGADFDAVVSDVEMPNLDGFRLTERIRESRGSLPVVLVTSLATAEERQRGLEAGADAYIVKSRFDESNLLEILGRLT